MRRLHPIAVATASVLLCGTLVGRMSPPETQARVAFRSTGPTTLLSLLNYRNASADCGAVHDGVTDDTAHIQACIDAVASAGGGGIYFPDGIYQLTVAPTTVNGVTAQLHLPSVSLGVNAGQGIFLFGSTTFPTIGAVFGGGGSVTPPLAGVVFRSTSTTAGSSIIEGSAPLAASYPFDILYTSIANIIFRTPNNPAISGLDFSGGGTIRVFQVTVDTGDYDFANIAQPTTATSYGVKAPLVNNSGSLIGDGLRVTGFYTGLLVGEHTNINNLVEATCLFAVEIRNNYFPVKITAWDMDHCPTGIRVVASNMSTQLPVMEISDWKIELDTTPSWVTNVYEIDDVNNYLHGIGTFGTVLSNTGQVSTFVKHGGTTFIATSMR